MKKQFQRKWTCPVCAAGNIPSARFCAQCSAENRPELERYDAFISYRREGGADAAAVIQLALREYSKSAFIDVTELQVGRFDEKLLDTIEKCDTFILILSKGCLDRCVDKNDWLKREIVHAIAHRRTIIPVILPGFAFPADETMKLMPEEMRVLPHLQGVEYVTTYRDAAVRKIMQYMAEGTRRNTSSPPPKNVPETGSSLNDKPVAIKPAGKKMGGPVLLMAAVTIVSVAVLIYSLMNRISQPQSPSDGTGGTPVSVVEEKPVVAVKPEVVVKPVVAEKPVVAKKPVVAVKPVEVVKPEVVVKPVVAKKPAAETVTDIDGNVYRTVRIGNQVWTAENLKTTKYNDGTPIPHVTDSATWSNLTTGAYCYYNNNAANGVKYGALYNWYAVNTGKLAPKGWRVPTEADWETLEKYLIENGYNWDGSKTENKIAKSMAAMTDWHTSTTVGEPGHNPGTNNSCGFLALPGGCRGGDGTFFTQSLGGDWWSDTEGGASGEYSRDLGFGREDLCRRGSKGCGFSVRLLRD